MLSGHSVHVLINTKLLRLDVRSVAALKHRQQSLRQSSYRNLNLGQGITSVTAASIRYRHTNIA